MKITILNFTSYECETVTEADSGSKKKKSTNLAFNNEKTPHISQEVHSSNFLLNCASFTPWQECFFLPLMEQRKIIRAAAN